MSIRVARLGHKHYRRFVPTARRHVAGSLAAYFLCKIFLAAEQHLYVLVEASATVPAYVYHHTLAVVVLTEEIGVYLAERVIVHRRYMDVAQSSARQPLDIGGTLLHPAVIQQVALTSRRYGTYHDVAASTVGGKQRHERAAT